MADEFVLCKCR